MSKNKKKKDKTKIYIGLSIFFLLLALILLYIYFFTGNKNTPFPQKSMEKEKIKIVDEESNERPLAVMIDNNVGTNSHAGLSESYINYEIIVEGGLTRIMAVFKDKDVPLIGPVRSSRHYFLDYALESDAIYAHFGWSPYAEKDIKALGVDNINGLTDSSPYWRDRTIQAPHNVFTSTSKLRETAKKKGYSLTSSNWEILSYSTKEINLDKKFKDSENLMTANNISMTYSNSQVRGYNYDPENKYYLRTMNNTPHCDKSTGQQLHYKNIIIEKVNNKTLDSYGRQDLDTTLGGDGYYITDGYATQIKWTKQSRSAKTKYTYYDGQEITLNDGNTFIQIVPLSSNIVIE